MSSKRNDSARLRTVGLGVLALFAGCALAEGRVSRIEIGPDRLLIVKSFRRRVVPRRDIESVRWEWGSGVSVRLVDGSWVRLPDLGLNSQGVANRLRAWLSRTETARGVERSAEVPTGDRRGGKIS